MKLMRFADLKARGIVANWQTLANWVEREGFPPGRMLGANTRAWTEDEIFAWIESRPPPADRKRDMSAQPDQSASAEFGGDDI